MNQLISGAAGMGYLIAGVFFLKYFKITRDRFYLLFASAFWVLALERIPLVLMDPAHESRSYVFLLRLAAFLVIITAIVDKNRALKPQHTA